MHRNFRALYPNAPIWVKLFDDKGVYHLEASPDFHNSEVEEVKLILRPVTDLTVQELKIWADVIEHKVTDEEVQQHHKKFIASVKKNGVNAFEVTKGFFFQAVLMVDYLRSRWIDIDNLIKQKKAISATTLGESLKEHYYNKLNK